MAGIRRDGGGVTSDLESVRQLLDECSRERERLEAFLRVSRLMNAEVDRARLIEKINEEVRDYLAADRFTVFFHDTDTDELYSFIATGVHRGEIRIPSDQGVAGHVYQSGETMCVADAYEDPRFNPDIDKRTGYRTRSLLSMPIVNRRGTKIGVVQALNKTTGDETFTPDDVDFLTQLVEQVSDLLDLLLRKEELARKNAAIQEAMSRLAVYDYLIGEKTVTKVAVRWSRKVHIWASIVGAIFLLVMAVSGIAVEHIHAPIENALWYNIHTGAIALGLKNWVYSDTVGLVLAAATVTGVVLWLYPIVTKWARARIERKAR